MESNHRSFQKVIREIRKRTMGRTVHRMYQFLRYDLDTLIRFRLYHNLKRGNGKKIGHFIGNQVRGIFHDLPRHITVDIVSCCNLRCPLCSVPPFITKKSRNFLPFETYKSIVDELDVASEIILVYAGEPLLHPDFFRMVRYAGRLYFTTAITNGTLLDSRRVEELLESGLDSLQISFDGFSRESFEKYRVGANFDSVKGNIERLIDARRRKRTGLPQVTITYLVNAYNEDELVQCREYFLGIGTDRFFTKAINLNVHRRLDGKKPEDLAHWLPRKSQVSLYEEHGDSVSFRDKQEPCEICQSPVIRCDGEVLLCCHDIFNTVKIGNVLGQSFRDLWFSKPYSRVRELGRQRRLRICRECGK